MIVHVSGQKRQMLENSLNEHILLQGKCRGRLAQLNARADWLVPKRSISLAFVLENEA